ncbi:hypothetical protein LY76DRAFT_24663 [Colletotrichum caudatum]|nr:hypothetical protein LY76DRAFT_24663 [Colletotrichum caudatum]
MTTTCASQHGILLRYASPDPYFDRARIRGGGGGSAGNICNKSKVRDPDGPDYLLIAFRTYAPRLHACHTAASRSSDGMLLGRLGRTIRCLIRLIRSDSSQQFMYFSKAPLTDIGEKQRAASHVRVRNLPLILKAYSMEPMNHQSANICIMLIYPISTVPPSHVSCTVYLRACVHACRASFSAYEVHYCTNTWKTTALRARPLLP